ncbi:patatin-like phospholipase family protein [Deinococcus radiophilus]|uniref:Patatin-like phospholipase family protein n=1 Tax=Deinococcus radiophilus TaxID=32062 RepID=A0A431W607_9DEIO|nr:patatin-like phospholipase family protein [Deinococcus radiophilus]RTR30851.1 patatin-like phospholipase family protein [Deinococcus radiophilus]UFA49432.1 patatin-like phospholipase family protein [Deinococcus radiophilus]
MQPPASRPLEPQPVALAISGGGGRSFYQVGALQALEDAGFTFNALAGTSSGAILAALLAAGHSGREIQRLLREANVPGWYDLTLGQGLVRPSGQQEWLESVLPPTFAELAYPLIVPTTDIQTGEEVCFESGPLVPAIMASSAFTGAVYPPNCEGRWLSDGGLVNEVPADLARRVSDLPVIALDATAPLLELDFPSPDEQSGGLRGLISPTSPSLPEILLQAFTVTQGHLTQRRLYEAAPEWLVDFDPLRELHLQNLDQLDRGVEIGYGFMQDFMDAGYLVKEE